VALGRAGRELLSRVALPAAGLYPLATVALCLLAFAAGQQLHVSGFLGVYLAALVLGNSTLPHRGPCWASPAPPRCSPRPGCSSCSACSPRRAPAPGAAGRAAHRRRRDLPGPAARRSSCRRCRSGCRGASRRSCRGPGLRGAVPIVIATIPVTEGLPGATRVVDVVFVLVVVYTLVQAPTLPWLGGGSASPRTGTRSDVEVEVAPLEQLGADLLQVRVGPRLAACTGSTSRSSACRRAPT
jgi:cell volume regulation protein A